MQVSEVPEPWASAMVAKDFTHAKRPSIRALARAAGIGSAETVRQMIYAGRAPEPETVDRVAAALGLSPVEVSGWVDQRRATRQPWRVPPEVAFLTDDEQTALTGLIKAIAKGRRPARTGSGASRRLRAVETHQEIAEAAIEEGAYGGTPPGQSEESDT